MSGVRADVRLVELGLAPSREKARTLIMAGEVFIDTLRIDKPGAAVPEDALLTVKEQAIPFVSRGGLKLDKAVRKYGLDFTDMVTMDVGSLYRRLYRLHAAKRRKKGIRHRCGLRTAGLEAEKRSEGRSDGAHKRPQYGTGLVYRGS